ncbi:MAG: hypothetical protein ACRCXZ_03610, partial [Patescibacteria group bacterium]
LSCPYSVDFKEVEIINKLKLYDQYGNTKDFDEIKTELVPINDFACDTTNIYFTLRVACYGTKDGEVRISNQTPKVYKAGTRFLAPIDLVDGNNKIEMTMVDTHDIENKINLDFDFVKLPLAALLKTDSDFVEINPNRGLNTISYTLTAKYQTEDKVMLNKDLTNKLSILSSSAEKNRNTKILNSKIELEYSEVKNKKSKEELKSAILSINYSDDLGRSQTKNCETIGKEESNKYYLYIKC